MYPQQYFTQPMYSGHNMNMASNMQSTMQSNMSNMNANMSHMQPNMSNMQNSMPSNIPSNMPAHMQSNMASFSRMYDAPLHSPSGFSQMSADGAPSLISDCSSVSHRSPHHGPTPIELPPLAGARDDRRRSSAPMLRLGVPGTFVQDNDFAMQSMTMDQFGDMRGGDMRKTQPMLQEPFMPQPQQQQQQQQALPAPTAFLPSQPRQPSPLQQQHPMSQAYNMQPQSQQQQQQQQQRRHSAYPMQQYPSTPMHSHNHGHGLPSISAKIDSGHGTPEDSPKDKMSLSNLTH
jgi:Myb-like DNA-binding protein FlbD